MYVSSCGSRTRTRTPAPTRARTCTRTHGTTRAHTHTYVHIYTRTYIRTHAAKIKFTQESSKMKMSVGHYLLLLPKV